jgi:hypothetical protein
MNPYEFPANPRDEAPPRKRWQSRQATRAVSCLEMARPSMQTSTPLAAYGASDARSLVRIGGSPGCLNQPVLQLNLASP